MVDISDVAEIEGFVNKRLNTVLLVAQSSLPDSQFIAFRKMTLDQFGRNGLIKDLRQLANDNEP